MSTVSNFPWLTLLWAIPVVGAAVIIVLPASLRQFAKYAGLVVALAVLVLSLALAGRFDPKGAQFQFVENHPWIPSFGTGYILGLDGIALALVVLTAVLVPLLLIAGWNDADGAAYRAKIEVLFSKTGDTETLLELRRLWKVEDAARRYLSECLPHPCPDLALRAHYREKLRKAME